MFVKQLQVGQFAVFAYIVGCKKTKEALVIDPADDEERILKEAADKGYRIKYIVNTHSHIDHVMGNRRMKELTGAEIIIHENEALSLIQQSPYMMSMFNAEPSPPADITVRGGDSIVIGEISLKVIHTLSLIHI
ncbi:MAG: MBL fold metallo-hydrolase, partial [Syntrophorhabdaceae bacterium]|nr:MBL fold metallo-hydrolase [Syntrophorhabdaceae bacterium]